MGAASPTGALHDAIVQRQDAIAKYVAALPYPAGARGVVVGLGGQFAALDLLDMPATLERVWPRLVASYALDALTVPEAVGTDAGAELPDSPAKAFTSDTVAALLASLSFVPCAACPTVGVGEDWRFEAEETVGQALVAENVCVHLSAFPVHGAGRDADRGGGISPPSARRRSFGGCDEEG